MPATTSIVPIVGDMHWNDLLGLFELRASMEIQSPFGNFRKEFRATAGDFAAAILWLQKLWTGQSLVTGADTMAYPVGDMAALGAVLTAGPTLAEDIPTLPDVIDVPQVPDGGAWPPEWDGTMDGGHPWGVTEG